MRRVVFVLVLMAAACRGDQLAPGVSDSAYVRAMAALRALPSAQPSTQQLRDRTRDSILRANGMNAAQFEAATMALADDPVRAAKIFRAIENRPVRAVPSPSEPVEIRKKDGATR